MILQCAAQGVPRAVQEDADVLVADSELPGDLLITHVVECPETEDLGLPLRQIRKSSPQPLGQLRRRNRLLWTRTE